MITYTNKLNMNAGAVPLVIHVSQYDQDFSLVFNLYNTVGTFTLESGTTVAIRGTKGDGNGYSVDATIDISNKRVTVIGDQQMTAIAGKNVFELTLYKNDKELNTANFILDVEPAALDKDTLASGSVIRELVNVIDRTDELIATANQIDSDKQIIAGYKTSAETAATNAANSAGQASTSATNAANSAQQAVTTVSNAQSDIEATRDAAIVSVNNAKSDALDDINTRAQQIVAITTEADRVAAEALSTANNAENHMATLDSQMQALEAAMQDVSIDPDDLGLEQDEDTYYVYPTYKGVRSENGIPLASSGGGGGGGGDTVSAILTVTNTTGWLSRTIAAGSNVSVTFSWSSIEDEMPTGDGAVRITVNDVVRSTYQISQGNVTIDLTQFLNTGTNKVKIRISDIYDQGKTTTFNITAVALSISSTFDASTVYSSTISFPYTPVGSVEKTVYFVLDGTTIGTQETAVSGRQMTYVIPAQNHGAHSIRVYFESTINGETVRSNELYYEFLFVDPLSTTPIIASSFHETSLPQYTTVALPFMVYTPNSLTSDITISANGTVVSTQTVDRTEQSYSYKANNYGTLTFVIATGSVSKTITVTITESDVHVEAETRNLVLHLSAQGRSNSEPNPGVWTYGQIECEFEDFNFTSDGWQTDSENNTVLRVSGDARLTIPYKPFAADFRTSGKTIEFEFTTKNVLDYDSAVLSCMSGNRGIVLTAQKATLKSEQSEISTQYKEDDHIRIAFVAEKRAKNRLLLVFINAIPSGVVQYPDGDNFSQTTPVNITVGSNDCTIDLYRIRIYDNDLERGQVLNNWIADTTDGTTMLDRYTRNNIYDAYSKIVVDNLPSNLPYFILNAEELPQYKGDKKTITGTYTDPMYPSKSFTFTGCQINVQGTSSAPYARKNYDMQFKEGFELASGHSSTYALRTGAIPFNRFVLKADVASSEGTNNVELVRLYNDACPYKTPEMVADSRVRWGIDGFPIVVFWNDTATNTVSFLGKYNFNLPKRAPAPYGYANDDAMESWEFENNTSNLLLFKSDYFDMTTYITDDGDELPNWRKDFEARFPSDAWLDIDILQEFVSFVYSTDRTQATNDNLNSAVTYDGVEYTQDTAAYRLAKFKAEFPTYAELDTFIFYYIFTELFLMVDSRAKNLFVGFNGSGVTASGRVATRKATAQPYDMDTGLGTNNEGSLVFGYSLEDIDHLTGGADIFNGQQSVLWCNLRDSYNTEIVRMYQTLRSNGILSYNTVEGRYEEHQSKWPEAVWIEDAWFKYIDPLINPDSGKEPTNVYLPMMQGSKEEQRKWWLINRFRYMDSKWNAGEALSQVIQLRGYAKANITVTPYADIYPAVRYGSYLVSERGTHGQATTLVCPIDELNDTEIYIYSAPQLESVGDLSGLKVGFADFSLATRLQSIKIGDSDANYDNTNLYGLSLGSNVLLKTLDVRNCSGLGDTSLEGHTQTTVDLSGCEIIENVYFDGTNITGVTLPNGGVLKVLSLPDTIRSLVVRNQPLLTTFSIEGNDYSNITTLRVENCGSVIPVLDILEDMVAGSRVRLIGFTTTASTTTDVEDFFDYLDTMNGLDENGYNVDTAQVQGTITGLGTITGAWLAQMNARYPYVTIEYEHITSNLYYYNGETLYYTESITDGGNGVYSGTPTKANSSDGHYSYTFAGWSKDEDDNTVDSDARTAVTADRSVYACYTATVRTYTVYWQNAGSTIETDTNVPWGTIPHYDGATPTSGGQTSTGWLPDPTQPITGNTTFVAQYLPVYTVTFKNETGSTTLDTQFVVQGGTATYGGTTPVNGTDSTLEFLGWATTTNAHTANASLTNVQSSMTVYAAFESAVEDVEITDSWTTILSGANEYKLGNYKPLDLGAQGIVNMQIVAINTDSLASGGGTAKYTWIAKELLATIHRMNPANSDGATGTGGNGGWENCEMRTYLKDTIKPLIPSEVRNAIVEVTKIQSTVTDSTMIKDGQTTTEDVWIPSNHEIFGTTTYESTGPVYTTIFDSAANRIKNNVSSGSAGSWWVRSASGASTFRYVGTRGNGSSGGASGTSGVALGFCTN